MGERFSLRMPNLGHLTSDWRDSLSGWGAWNSESRNASRRRLPT